MPPLLLLIVLENNVRCFRSPSNLTIDYTSWTAPVSLLACLMLMHEMNFLEDVSCVGRGGMAEEIIIFG